MSYNENKTTDSSFNELNYGGICQICNKETDKLWVSTITTDGKQNSYLLCRECASRYMSNMREKDSSISREANEVLPEHPKKHSLLGKKVIIIICLTLALCAAIIVGAIGLRNYLSIDEKSNGDNIAETDDYAYESDTDSAINDFNDSNIGISADGEIVKSTNSVKNEKKYLSTDYRNFGYSEAQIKKFIGKYDNKYNMYDESEGRKEADRLVKRLVEKASNQYYRNKTPIFLFSYIDWNGISYVYCRKEDIEEFNKTGDLLCCEGIFVSTGDESIYGASLLGSGVYLVWINGNDTTYWEEKATALLESTFPEYRGEVSEISLSEDEILINIYGDKSFVTDYDLDYIEEVEYREIYV